MIQKFCNCVNYLEDSELLNKDLQKLIEWSQDWQMQFNIDKCAVMHMGRKNQQHE